MPWTPFSGLSRPTVLGASLAGVVVLSAAAGAGANAKPAGPPAESRIAAGTCASTYHSGRDLTAKQQLASRTAAGDRTNGVASEPVFSRDSRSNRYLAYTSTATDISGTVTPGLRNVYAVKRTGAISPNANEWQIGNTALVSTGRSGPADGDSWGASLSGYTGAQDAAKGPERIAFLSRATNLAPGGNPTGVSAFVRKLGGGSIERIKAAGEATGVGISGDSKVVYVTTSTGLYVVQGKKVKRLASGSGFRAPSTTLNGKQAVYEQSGTIYTVTLAGKKRKITDGTDPASDGGDPAGGKNQGFVRAIAYRRGDSAWRAELGRKVRVQRFGHTQTAPSINVGGNGIAFGNKNHSCLEVQLLDKTRRRGGYSIPQGACPSSDETVTDTAVSTRYNYLAFTCSGGGLYLHYVGPK